MTIAVAKALIDTLDQDDERVKTVLTNSIQKWGHRFPDAGYGGIFIAGFWRRIQNLTAATAMDQQCGFQLQDGSMTRWRKHVTWQS